VEVIRTSAEQGNVEGGREMPHHVGRSRIMAAAGEVYPEMKKTVNA
jgi:hypothetical protein